FTALLCFCLAKLYQRYGKALSNRRMFSANFLLIGVTTMIIITIVKSSLALSLGLVGALSIIRFRTAIKDPEELAYLFLVISIGLGFGANQSVVTLVGFVFVCFCVLIMNIKTKHSFQNNLLLSISSEHNKDTILKDIISLLKQSARRVNLRQIYDKNTKFEAVFIVELLEVSLLDDIRLNIKKLDSKIEINFNEYIPI
ncbi:DUF4956 domain-containing protein, partial [Candidatus Marinamargulisbacteria bacterium SCGC AG-414-C22]